MSLDSENFQQGIVKKATPTWLGCNRAIQYTSYVPWLEKSPNWQSYSLFQRLGFLCTIEAQLGLHSRKCLAQSSYQPWTLVLPAKRMYLIGAYMLCDSAYSAMLVLIWFCFHRWLKVPLSWAASFSSDIMEDYLTFPVQSLWWRWETIQVVRRKILVVLA